jgi:hypothetical protein
MQAYFWISHPLLSSGRHQPRSTYLYTETVSFRAVSNTIIAQFKDLFYLESISIPCSPIPQSSTWPCLPVTLDGLVHLKQHPTYVRHVCSRGRQSTSIIPISATEFSLGRYWHFLGTRGGWLLCKCPMARDMLVPDAMVERWPDLGCKGYGSWNLVEQFAVDGTC